jgi:hypothetical protein
VGKPVKDRRRDPRYGWSPDEITRATLRPGCRVHVVDLSTGGALVQGEQPLRAGAHVHFQIVTKLRMLALSARVLPCKVWMLHSSHGAARIEARFSSKNAAIGSGKRRTRCGVMLWL